MVEEKQLVPLKVFQIRHVTTCAIIWIGMANSEIDALDFMARHTGYDGRDDLPEVLKGGAVKLEIL